MVDRFTYGHFKAKWEWRFSTRRLGNSVQNEGLVIFDNLLKEDVYIKGVRFYVTTPYSIIDNYLTEYLIEERDNKIKNLLND